MIKGLRFFTSRVAKRIFGLFVLCALLPIGTLALVTFGHVAGQLRDQNHRRIQQECKSIGMAILERLLFLETEVEAVADHIGANPDSGFENLSETFKERLSKRFVALSILGSREQLLPVYGNPDEPPWPSKEELTGLRSGKMVLACRNSQDGPSRVFMMRLLDVEHPDQGILVGRIRANHLWGIGDMNTLPAMSELSVFDESEKILLSSIPLPQSFRTNLVNKVNDSKERRFQWSYEGEEYLASSWIIFLKSRYSSPSWTVVLSQAKNLVLAPTAAFKQIFPLVMLMSLLAVVLLSAIQIRRHLVPLEKLKEATQLIGQGLFHTSVTISSGDEFEDLADSFNQMSKHLGKQFQALNTMGVIDRAVLASLEKEKIIETLLSRMGNVCSYNNVEVGIVSNRAEHKFSFFSKARQDGNIEHGSNRTVSDEELDALYNNRHYLCINTIDLVPNYVKPLVSKETRLITVLPFFVGEKLSGIIILGYSSENGPEPQDTNSLEIRMTEDFKWARQLADQVAVALSNAHLLEELDKLSWGALTALARTVDAKSHWTAGHSERVTELAMKLGKTMNLTDEELKTLQRGALIHDIGKVGVPAAILDKTDKLTDEEFGTIKSHPTIGGRILEPIESFSDILSIVLQHHERYDGSGYPEGLKGEEISLGSRIVAVADVFEAVTADRPYRPGWKTEKAVELIKDGAGSHFDPLVVSAFLKVIEKAKSKKKEGAGVMRSKKNELKINQTEKKNKLSATTPVMKPGYRSIQRATVEDTHC